MWRTISKLKKLLSVPALNKFETTINVFNNNIINQQISYHYNTRNKFMNDSFYQVLPEQVKNKNDKFKKTTKNTSKLTFLTEFLAHWRIRSVTVINSNRFYILYDVLSSNLEIIKSHTL